jgi:hypothetical protein
MRMTFNPLLAIRAAVVAAALVLCAGPALAADTVHVANDGGYARLLFTLAPATHAKASVTGAVLTIAFDRKVTVDPAGIASNLPSYIGSGRADPDGKTFRFALAQTVRLHTSSAGNQTAIDLAPPGFAATPPDLPQPAPPAPTAVDIAKLEPLKVRAGAYQNFTRIVFDWPRNVPYTAFPGAGKLTLRFEAQARPDLSTLDRQAPPWVKNAGWRIESKGTVIEFETDADSGFHDFRDGTHIVVDILAPKTDADSYAPPGMGKIKPTPFAAKPTAPNSAVSGAQVQAIAATAAKLSAAVTTAPPAKPTPDKQASAAPQVLTTPQPANAATAQAAAPQPPAAPQTQDADGKLTRDGAVMSFPGASQRGSAVFMRGTTAWIVLQNAPPLDAAKLKAALGTFPDAVDAASADGVSVLRITLKQQEQIGAYADGSNLKVVIAPQVSQNAIAIGFARNQDDATHSSLTTLLPGASHTVQLVDPIAGDVLILVPAAVGRAMIEPRSYVEFATLQTASGMVLTPFVDDLDVGIDTTRVTITRHGGLSLTPPTMPVADSPAALAKGGEGPCYLDFANWSKADGGSFLAAERRLRAATARLKPEDANHARLALARFYLANRFSAEALGLINLMQAADPALQSDMQLQTMRAAADYEMGRYRDAHNDIAGTQFDSDRHAALWRGLIEAALENWDAAQADLERAGPVLRLYSADWQARVRIAVAQAGLGRGHLEIVDAALARLPRDMTRGDMLDAQLARARLYAAENRTRDANEIFASLEKSGDDRAAAQAIFYRVSAALASGAISQPAAIDALEKLRFRWRGDALEMKTLRKLSALYFAKQRWRDGMQMLRLAVQSFPNDDLARQAQDDMRAAFVNLYLNGQADKIAPVASLSLFYEFIDLTPIGPDGDEMIRRMSDRLVAVDLLGPAADLLSYQIDKRLDGVARAQVATTLARIYLLDHKPQSALDTLRATRISTLPDDVNHQRMLLEARALAGLKQWNNALDMVAVDMAPDTARLRADIYWQSGNWAVAGQKTEENLGPRWSDAATLSADERQQVMRAAVAYSLANDETSLDRLRDHFGAKMKSSPDANAFTVVTQRIDMQGIAFRDAAAQVASIDTLQAFMKDMHTDTARTN